MAILAAAALPFTFVACDDDGDGNIDNPDVDPGAGTGLPGDDLDEELNDEGSDG
jgi:hypothetical protein